MGVIIQNFSIAMGDDMDVPFVQDPTDDIVYSGATISWGVFGMTDAVVDLADGSIIFKQSPTWITIIDSPEMFTVHMLAADTVGMLGNYYHEARVVDFNGNIATVVKGVMTVTQTALTHL